MTIRNLEIFTKVAELGSMSAAAKELYITQPSVSLAIAEIEKEYDVKLFDRIGNRLCLNPTGHQLMEYTSSIIHQYKEMEMFLKDESHNTSIRVGATATIGHHIISSIIDRLEKEMPGIKCEVMVASTGVVEERLIHSELDIGFVEGDITSRALVVNPILEDELCVVCSKKHRFYKRDSITLNELNDENFILRETGSGTRAKVESILRENHIVYHPQWSCYSFESIKEAIMHNLGITIMSPRVARRELQNGELWSCNIEDVSFKRTFDLVYRQNKYFSAPLIRFVEICENMKILEPDF